MDEILKRDQNRITVLAGVTNDSAQDITMLRVDPITKRLLVAATGGGGGSVTDVTASSPLSSSGGSTPNISLTGVVSLSKGGTGIPNNLVNVTSAGGTTTLTASSSRWQNLTGSTFQTFKLPDATTLDVGTVFDFSNNSSGGVLHVTDNGSNTVYSNMPIGGEGYAILLTNATANGTWDFHGTIPKSQRWGTGALNPANGGFGQSMDMITDSTTGSRTTFPCGLVKYTGAGTPVIRGIVAPTTSNFFYIENASSSQIQITNQDGTATPINRIITTGGGILVLNPGFSAWGFYDTVTARFRVLGITYIQSVSFPFVVSSAGNLTMPQATTGQSGWLNQTDFNTFINKMSASGASLGEVPYFNGTSTVLGTPPFNFDATRNMFGVGTTDYTYNEATGHFKADTALTIPALNSIVASLTPFTPLDVPFSYTVTQLTGHMNAVTAQTAVQSTGHILLATGQLATQSPGHLYAPTSFVGNIVMSTTNYMAGDVIDYRITAYDSTGTLTYSVVNSLSLGNTITTGTGAADGDEVDLSWTDNTTGTATISGYFIERQVNGGGYNDAQDVGLVNAFIDVGTGWGAYTYPLAPTFPDFIANLATRDYNIWQGVDDGMGGYIWAVTGATASMTDDSSGNPYVVAISWSGDNGGTLGTVTNFRTYNQVNGGGYNQYYDIATAGFTEDSAFSWTGGSPPPSPQTTDYIANGATYDYQIWQAGDDGMGGYIFSVVNSVASMSDSADGVPFVNAVSWTPNTSGTVAPTLVRVFRNITSAGYLDYQDFPIATTSFNDDGTGWTAVIMGEPPPLPQYPDFVANGSTRNYSAYSKGLAPDNTDLFSQTSYDVPFMDDNSNNSYLLEHLAYSTSNDIRILNTDLTTYADAVIGVPLDEDTTQPFVAGSTVTPNTFGLLANGTNWTRDYDFYNFSSPLGIYSTSSGISSVTDPNDGLYYYVTLSFSGSITYAKILQQLNSGGYLNSEVFATSPALDTGANFTSMDVTVTPTSVYSNAGLFEAHDVNVAQIIRSLDGSAPVQEFRDNTNTVLGSRKGSAVGLIDTNMSYSTYVPIDPSLVPNNSYFVDSTNSNIASFKDNGGTTHALY